MKKICLLTAMMATLGITMAQDLQTYSVYDTNHSGDFTPSDVTGVINQIKVNAAPESTSQYVTAEDLKEILQRIDSRLAAIEEKLNIDSPSQANTHQGHAYVDLGLTDENGKPIYWATCNIGAETPDQIGGYFAWGETTARTKGFDWSHYTLTSADDAAAANWGGSWRMPTQAELTQLLNICNCAWKTTETGVSGLQVTGPNENSIFLPAAGFYYYEDEEEGDLVSGEGQYGYYWSSSLGFVSQGEDPNAAVYLEFSSVEKGLSSIIRSHGLTIRPVLQLP